MTHRIHFNMNFNQLGLPKNLHSLRTNMLKMLRSIILESIRRPRKITNPPPSCRLSIHKKEIPIPRYIIHLPTPITNPTNTIRIPPKKPNDTLIRLTLTPTIQKTRWKLSTLPLEFCQLKKRFLQLRMHKCLLLHTKPQSKRNHPHRFNCEPTGKKPTSCSTTELKMEKQP